MSHLLRLTVLLCALMPLSAGADQRHSGHGHHHHGGFSAGEPGNPKQRSRTIQVAMKEVDGKMIYLPARLELRKGEQIKFVLRNSGEVDHEFVLATTEENLKHAQEMQDNPDMAHEEPNARRLAPAKSAGLLWRFTKSGEFEYGCLLPGHREAGMIGKIIVK